MAARPLTKYIHTENMASSGVNTAINTRIDYGYNWQDQLRQTTAQVGSSYYYHAYDYNGRGLLSAVKSWQSANPSVADVTYT